MRNLRFASVVFYTGRLLIGGTDCAGNGCCSFKQHHISTEVFLFLFVYLYWLHHVELGELGYVGVHDDVSIYLAPFFLTEYDLSFLPVVHPYFIEAGAVFADEYELVPTALCKGYNDGHFKFAFHGH